MNAKMFPSSRDIANITVPSLDQWVRATDSLNRQGPLKLPANAMHKVVAQAPLT